VKDDLPALQADNRSLQGSSDGIQLFGAASFARKDVPVERRTPKLLDQPGPPLRRRPFGLSVRLDHPRSEGRIRTHESDEVGAVPERQRSPEGGVCR